MSESNATETPHPPRQERALRVGLLIDSVMLPAWRYRVVELINRLGFAEIALIILNDSPLESPKGTFAKLREKSPQLLYLTYQKIDRWLFRTALDPYAQKNLQSLQLKCPIIKVRPRRTAYSDYFSDQEIAEIVRHDLDVALRFGFRIIRGKALSIARHGIWSYHHGDNRTHRGTPPCFWETMCGESTTGTILQVLSEDLDNGHILYQTETKTDRRSVQRNREGVYWKAANFVPRSLAALRSSGSLPAPKTDPAPYSHPLRRVPGNAEMSKLLLGFATRYASEKLTDVRYKRKWQVLFHFDKTANQNVSNFQIPSMYRFRTLDSPPDRYWADPFPWHRDGRYYIFMEEKIYSRKAGGIISVIEVDESGVVGSPVRCLEKEYHLSYPFVFEWDGRLMMIPESSQNGTVDLYECQEFPHSWVLRRTLLSGVRAVDATLHESNGCWWMFVNIAAEHGSTYDELHVYMAETPLGPWRAHSSAPVKSTVRSCRPAGKIFNSAGKLYRPSQDCSRRYGYAVSINEITELSEHGFSEQEVTRIQPDWSSQVLATHTLNREKRLTVIDALVARRRIL